jgi:UDP-N-acetyl-2-amino-2-deoxyglucuronate dehydrogenase
MKKLKTGIIGCGKVSHIHAKALAASTYSVFSAVCSRTQSKADGFAAQYGVRAYDDVSRMITEESLDVVIVCTPHPFHAEPTIQSAEAGAHILVEKPLASSLEDCDAMINAAKKAGVRLGVVSQRRFYAPCQRIRKAIDEGKIGKPILGTVTMLGWRDQKYYQSDPWRGKWDTEGGGVLVNQAPHQLDLLQWFMGPIAELFGCWDNLNHPYIEVEDTAIAVIRFQNGALGSIVVSNSQNPAQYGKVLVTGSNGACIGVQTDGGAMFVAGMSDIEEPPVNDHWTIPGEENMLSIWRQQDTEFFKRVKATEYYHRLQIDDFLTSIIEGHQLSITGDEGRKTVEIFTAIYRSRRDNKPIRFPLQPEYDARSYDGRLNGRQQQ